MPPETKLSLFPFKHRREQGPFARRGARLVKESETVLDSHLQEPGLSCHFCLSLAPHLAELRRLKPKYQDLFPKLSSRGQSRSSAPRITSQPCLKPISHPPPRALGLPFPHLPSQVNQAAAGRGRLRCSVPSTVRGAIGCAPLPSPPIPTTGVPERPSSHPLRANNSVPQQKVRPTSTNQPRFPTPPAAAPPACAWARTPPTSATQTAATGTQSRPRLREAPNQRAAPRPRRERARWAPGAGACVLRALVRDSWRRPRRRGWSSRRWRPERAALQVKGRARRWDAPGQRHSRGSSGRKEGIGGRSERPSRTRVRLQGGEP